MLYNETLFKLPNDTSALPVLAIVKDSSVSIIATILYQAKDKIKKSDDNENGSNETNKVASLYYRDFFNGNK